jgi:hypothetical protein
MWLTIRDAEGAILGREDLHNTGWLMTERGLVNGDVISIAVERPGIMTQGFITPDETGDNLLVAVKVPEGPLEHGQEIDFTAGALIIFSKGES